MIKKDYKDLKFIDDFIFCKILSTNPKLCKELIELILAIKIKDIKVSESQKVVNQTYDGKGVRFDVYLEDNTNSVYDIEMQTTRQKDLGKRTRYYQGMIDLNLIEKGAKYSKLKKTFIIFICLNVPFPDNLPIYTFNNICEENKSIYLNDDATKVIINANGNRTGLSQDMCAFLDFLQNKSPKSEFTEKLQKAVEKATSNEEWEVEYMTMAMKIQEEREEAKIETTIGLLSEFQWTKENIINKLIKDFDLTKEEAVEYYNQYLKEH